MRVFHLSDIHGDLKSLEVAVAFVNKESNDSDFVAVTGDFPGTHITPNFWEDIHQKRGARLTHEALKESEISAISRHYVDLKSIVDGIRIPVFSVPGNCDWVNYEHQLIGGNHQTVHKNSVTYHGVRIAGFGGSDAVLPYLRWHPHYPVHETVLQNPKHPSDGHSGVSNLYDFFASLREIPQIVLTHMTPRRFQPMFAAPQEDIGSYGLMDYLGEHANILALCGHQHESSGLQYRGKGIVVINAGNLGVNDHDKRTEGSFFVIEYDGKFTKADCFLLSPRKEISQAETYILNESGLHVKQRESLRDIAKRLE